MEQVVGYNQVGRRQAGTSILIAGYHDADGQIGLIERDLKLLDLHDPKAHIQSVILSAAEQSNIDASLVDSIELYHLANAPEKVIDAVTRTLAQSLSLHSGNRSVHLGQRLDLQGAFGGTEDILQLANTVLRVYEHDNSARQIIGPKKWDALKTLVLLKRAMGEFDADRPEQALEVSYIARAWRQVTLARCTADLLDVPPIRDHPARDDRPRLDLALCLPLRRAARHQHGRRPGRGGDYRHEVHPQAQHAAQQVAVWRCGQSAAGAEVEGDGDGLDPVCEWVEAEVGRGRVQAVEQYE